MTILEIYLLLIIIVTLSVSSLCCYKIGKRKSAGYKKGLKDGYKGGFKNGAIAFKELASNHTPEEVEIQMVKLRDRL